MSGDNTFFNDSVYFPCSWTENQYADKAMILGYKKNLPGDPYWFGDFEEEQKQFIRVCCGLALPQFDRSNGALVVIGESLRPSGPQDFTAVGGVVGAWPTIENALVQYRMDLKFSHVVTETVEARQLIWRMPKLSYGSGEIPLVSYEAPKYAFDELGRQKVEGLIAEDRLRLDEVRADLEEETQASGRALQAVICWMSENKTIYASNAKKREPLRAVWGLQGL